MASLSDWTPLTSVEEMSGATETVTEIATVSAVAVSILSAIDDRRRRKFDVRNRQQRTVLNLKIDRDNVFAKGHSELRNWDVARMFLVRVERCAIDERDRQAGIVRTRRSDDIGANLQAGNAVDILQRGESGAMVVLRRLAGAGFVLEADQMKKHRVSYNSSPSISSSPTSTTTL